MIHSSRRSARSAATAALSSLFGFAALFAAGTSAAATTIVGGNVINQTWTAAGSPYIVEGDVTVPAGAFLTLQAGAVVQMTSSDGQGAGVDTSRVEITINGTLNVEGTSGSPVTLEPESGSSANTWYGVIVGSGATAAGIAHANVSGAVIGVLSHAAGTVTQVSGSTISSCATGMEADQGTPTLDTVTLEGNTFGLAVEGSAAPTVTGSQFLSNGSYGLYTDVTSAATTAVRQCTFDANFYGIYIDSGTSPSATIDVVDTIVTGGTYGVYRSSNGIANVTYSDVWGNSGANLENVTTGTGVFASNPLFVNGASNVRLTSNSPARFAGDSGGDIGALAYVSDATPGLYGTLWSNKTLTAASSPYVAAGDITIAKGVTLSVDPGVTIQFTTTDIMASGVDTSRAELIVDGVLSAIGSKASHVSMHATTASANAWYGITLAPGATGSSLAYVDVSGAVVALYDQAVGSNSVVSSTFTGSSTGIEVTAGAPAFDSLFVTGNTFGIALEGSAGAAITNSVIASNGSYGIYADVTSATTTSVMNCTLDANFYGIYVDSGTSPSAVIDIQNSIVASGTYGVYRSSNGLVSVTYSDVWGNSGANYENVTTGTGTIAQNPNFVSAPADLALESSSVCIDSGNATGAPDHDIVGVHRPVNGTGLGTAQWDMGAYEFVPTPTCGDGVVQSPEQCDDGASNGTSGDCCSATCEFQPSTLECRAASGACYAAAYCDGAGSCPPDAPLTGTSCAGGTCAAGTCVETDAGSGSSSSSSSSGGASSSSSSSSSGGASSSSSSSSSGGGASSSSSSSSSGGSASSGSSSGSSGGSSSGSSSGSSGGSSTGSSSGSSGGSSTGSSSGSSGGSSGGSGSGSSGASSSGSSSGSSGGASSGAVSEDDGGVDASSGRGSNASGCGCTTAGSDTRGGWAGMSLIGLALAASRRRRRDRR